MLSSILIPTPPIFHGKISGGEAEKKEKKNTLGLHKARQNQP